MSQLPLTLAAMALLIVACGGCTGGILLGSEGGYINEWVTEDVAMVGPEFMSDVGEITIIDGGNVLLLGWVDIEWSEFYPITLRRRPFWERIIFFTPNERDVVLHEICHSYQLNTVGSSDEETVLDCIECLKEKREG